jgi:hypothetical protein
MFCVPRWCSGLCFSVLQWFVLLGGVVVCVPRFLSGVIVCVPR